MNTRVNRFFLLLVILFFIILIPFTGDTQEAKKPYKIGYIVCITGPGSVYGNQELESAQLAVSYINEKWGGINGNPLELVVEDTRTDPAIALTKFKRLEMEVGVPAMITALSSAEVVGLAEYANRFGVPTMTLAGTLKIAPQLQAKDSHCYRIWYTTKNHVENLFKAALVGRKIKTMAVMYDDTAYGETALETIRELTKANNIQIVTEIKYAYTGLDFTPEAIKIRSLNPNAVFVGDAGVPTGAVIPRNLREIGYKGLIGATCGIFSKTPEVGSIVNGVLSDLLGPAPGEAIEDVPNPTPELRKFVEWGKQKSRKTAVTWVGMFNWDNTFALATAMKAVGPDRKKIRDFLEKYESQGTAGYSRFSPGDHEGLKGLAIYRAMEARDGKWVPLK